MVKFTRDHRFDGTKNKHNIKTTNTYSYYEPHIIDKLSNQLILSNHIPFDYFESSNILRWSEARKR